METTYELYAYIYLGGAYKRSLLGQFNDVVSLNKKIAELKSQGYNDEIKVVMVTRETTFSGYLEDF